MTPFCFFHRFLCNFWSFFEAFRSENFENVENYINCSQAGFVRIYPHAYVRQFFKLTQNKNKKKQLSRFYRFLVQVLITICRL